MGKENFRANVDRHGGRHAQADSTSNQMTCRLHEQPGGGPWMSLELLQNGPSPDDIELTSGYLSGENATRFELRVSAR
jgi:hypothetical protein